MTYRVDPVAVARRCIEAPLNERQEPIAASSIGVQAMARVVLAAEEVIASVPATYDEMHPTVQRHAAALIALAAALKGGKCERPAQAAVTSSEV